MIQACVQNVADQDAPPFEHIVVDGGSTDGTVERLKDLSNRYSHLVFRSEPDLGQSDAMNKGLALASGEIVSFLNADDYYEKQTCREALQVLTDQKVPTLVAANCRVVDQAGRLLYWNKPKELRANRLLLGWQYYQFPCNPSAYFYHKAVHDITGPYDIDDHYSMDLSFIFECALAVKMIYTDKHWGNMRLMPGTKTFEDKHNSESRTKAISERYVARLPTWDRLAMPYIKLQRDISKPFVSAIRGSLVYQQIVKPLLRR